MSDGSRFIQKKALNKLLCVLIIRLLYYLPIKMLHWRITYWDSKWETKKTEIQANNYTELIDLLQTNNIAINNIAKIERIVIVS